MVFPAVDLDNLHTTGDVAVTVGEVGRMSGNDGSSRVGSGILWVMGTGSTCCCCVLCAVFSGAGEGHASGWL